MIFVQESGVCDQYLQNAAWAKFAKEKSKVPMAKSSMRSLTYIGTGYDTMRKHYAHAKRVHKAVSTLRDGQ